MISLIVCSVSLETFNIFEKSVLKTIGTENEIIRIDNSNNKYSICEAYNEGAAKAKYAHLCFVHEDIVFVSENWGINLIKHLSDPDVGLIGIAGAAYKGEFPYSWSVPKLTALHIIQKDRNIQERNYRKINKLVTEPAQVLVLDGVFLATKKDVFRQIQFDDEMLKGFHGYDIDFSFSVSRYFKVYVVFDILLEHYSKGNHSKDWFDNAVKICKKWKKELPSSLYPLNKTEQREINNHCFSIFIGETKSVGYPFFKRLWLIIYYMPYNHLTLLDVFKLLKKIR